MGKTTLFSKAACGVCLFSAWSLSVAATKNSAAPPPAHPTPPPAVHGTPAPSSAAGAPAPVSGNFPGRMSSTRLPQVPSTAPRMPAAPRLPERSSPQGGLRSTPATRPGNSPQQTVWTRRTLPPHQTPPPSPRFAQAQHPINRGTPPDIRRAAAIQARSPMSTRMLQCGHGAPAPGSCGVWGRFGGPVEQSRLRNVTQLALRSGNRTSIWVGSDGVARQLSLIAAPPQYMTVTLLTGPGVYVIPGRDFDPQSVPPPPSPPYDVPDDGGGKSGPGSTLPDPPPAAPPGGMGATSPGPGNREGSTTPEGPSSAPPHNKGPDLGDINGPKQRICRQVSTAATVGTEHDDAAEIWCRNDDGDWAPAMLADKPTSAPIS